MKLGRTSFVYFVSRVVATVAGFLATIYFARVLGADILGIYYLAVALVFWLAVPTSLGINSAISKRVSEQEDVGEYTVAGAMIVGGMLMLVIVAVLVARQFVNGYIGHSVTYLIVVLLLAETVSSYVVALLQGQHQVHIVGILVPIGTISRSLLQVTAIALGYKLVAMLVSHAMGTVVATVIGLVTLSLKFERPKRQHFQELFSFAQYSWLGQIRSRMFNRMDIIVLGFFVSSELVGVYSISWNVASFLGIFASSVSATLFPELSKLSAQEKSDDVRDLVRVSMSYAGLIHIPGLIGAIILGPRILRIYGDAFVKGQTVLVILILAYLVQSYNQQILTALDAVDRPDLSFRANAILVLSNIGLNVSLVYLYGWIGAAVATTVSIGLSMVLGYRYLSRLVSFDLPVRMVLKQFIAGLIMGGIVFLGLWSENTYGLLANNVMTVLILVGLGATVYFFVLLGISPRFRKIVYDNLPAGVTV